MTWGPQMIKQIHLDVCDSTQDVLKEQLNTIQEGETTLVSCALQKAGRGRGENSWISMEGTVCFSMNIVPHRVLSFTAIELSVLIAKYFENKNKKLKLKWPNDLWDEDMKKCGGILVQGSNKFFAAGIGINYYSDSAEYGGIFRQRIVFDKKQESRKMAEFILNNRIESASELESEWLKRCGHLNQMVKIIEGSESYEGIFQGLGSYGEAVVCCDGAPKKIFNGTLRIV